VKNREPLTETQKAVLDFFVDFQRRRGIAPTHREICEHFGYSSYGTAHKHLKHLREKGYLLRRRHQKRGFQLVEKAEGRLAGDTFDLPFFGRIAAGRPIEALPGDERLTVPRHLLGSSPSRHYVLKVVGDSMIEEGIHDGDLVVVQGREEADAGEMVVALVSGEATLKRFYPENGWVRLQPANPYMEPLRVQAGDVRIQGVVVGLMRKF
jgi:repressor LexA